MQITHNTLWDTHTHSLHFYTHHNVYFVWPMFMSSYRYFQGFYFTTAMVRMRILSHQSPVLMPRNSYAIGALLHAAPEYLKSLETCLGRQSFSGYLVPVFGKCNLNWWGCFSGLIDWSFWDWRRNQQSGLNPPGAIYLTHFSRHRLIYDARCSICLHGSACGELPLIHWTYSFGGWQGHQLPEAGLLGYWRLLYSLLAFRIVSRHMLKFQGPVDQSRFGIDLVSVSLFLAVNWSNIPLLTASSEDMRREWCAGCWFSPSFCWCLV